MKLSDKYRNLGDYWALVTGAASGIGLAFAHSLASLGYNLILVDIDGVGLQRVAAGVQSRYGVAIHTFTTDLSRPDAARELHDFCTRQGISPFIVVNNAGIFSYNDVVATDPACIVTMTGLHVTTVSLVSRLFAEDMSRNERKTPEVHQGKRSNKGRRGYILNVSSYSAWMPWPGLALYSATKAYILNFSLSLAAEMRGRRVSVTTVLPAGVTTGLYGLAPKWQRVGRRLGILLTPERTAEMALAAMFRGRRQYVPSLLMRLVLPVVRSLPGWVVRIARRKTLRFQK